MPKMSPYIAAKHAVVGIMRSAALECAPLNIRVNTINPSPIATRMIDAIEAGFAPGAPDKAKARRLFQQWIHSRPHYRTLVNSGFKFVSTGVVQKGNSIWAIQVFFAPLPEGIKPSGAPDGIKPSGATSTLY